MRKKPNSKFKNPRKKAGFKKLTLPLLPKSKAIRWPSKSHFPILLLFSWRRSWEREFLRSFKKIDDKIKPLTLLWQINEEINNFLSSYGVQIEINLDESNFSFFTPEKEVQYYEVHKIKSEVKGTIKVEWAKAQKHSIFHPCHSGLDRTSLTTKLISGMNELLKPTGLGVLEQ